MKYFFIFFFALFSQTSFSQNVKNDSTEQFLYFSQQASEKVGNHVLLMKNGDTIYYTMMSSSPDINQVKKSYQWSDTTFVQSINTKDILKYDLIKSHEHKHVSKYR